MGSKIYLQITSGRGPAECGRVVALVLEKIVRQAKAKGLNTEILYREPGPMNRTLASVTLWVEGAEAEAFVNKWEGTVQWISQSPYRMYHKRKNWFVGVHSYKLSEGNQFAESDIVYQTLRASGPGGQHVNKTESAVRAVHRPSGISVTAMDQRSQFQNKKLATERLAAKLAEWHIGENMKVAQENWDQHNQLQRGNPVQTIQEELKA